MVASNEDAELISRMEEENPYPASSLDERDQMLADRLVSRGALRRGIIDKKWHYTPDRPDIWRF
jgi:hypothetical protein